MTNTNMTVAVIATRGNDLFFPNEFGKLRNFRFVRNADASYEAGEVKVRFPSWAIAQKAVSQLRKGDANLWNSYCH